MTHNPVKGVKRPKVESYEGKTPALGDGQARALLDAPGTETQKAKQDRAILSVLLYHGLRSEELCTLKVRDIHPRRGVLHLRVRGKGGKVRYLPLHPGTADLVTDYFEAVGHGGETAGALFRPAKNNVGGTMEGRVTADGVYKMVKHYANCVGDADSVGEGRFQAVPLVERERGGAVAAIGGRGVRKRGKLTEKGRKRG